MRSLRLLRALRAGRGTAPPGEPVEVALRPLGRRRVAVRPGTSDAEVVWETFSGRYHLPPAEVGPAGGVRLVWDLGANIGLTMADLARRFPAARIVGVELDEANAALARRNVAPWGDRCEVVRAAVQPADGEVGYAAPAGEEYGFHVTGATGEGPRSPAVSLDTLLAREAAGTVVDYVKMDIEGAEAEVLTAHTAWAARVRTLKVELHGGYTSAACRRDLEALGFRTAVDDRHWACVVGVRGQA